MHWQATEAGVSVGICVSFMHMLLVFCWLNCRCSTTWCDLCGTTRTAQQPQRLAARKSTRQRTVASHVARRSVRYCEACWLVTGHPSSFWNTFRELGLTCFVIIAMCAFVGFLIDVLMYPCRPRALFHRISSIIVWLVKPSFHYPSWRPELTGDGFPFPVSTARVDG